MALRTEEDQDAQLNPGERHGESLHERAQSLHDQEQQAAYDQDFNDIVDNSNLKDDTDSSRSAAQDQEENPYTPNQMNWSGTGKGRSSKQKFDLKNTLKKRGPIGALVAVLGFLGISIVPFFGMIMPIDLMERLTKHNDSASTVLERRAVKVFGNMTGPSDPVCKNSTKNIKCRMGRISNKALYNLDKKGVKAVGYEGARRGYPDQNPTAYTFTEDNGKTRTVQAKDMSGFLAQPQNRKFAAQILGQRGAFNVRVQTWAGKHINQKLYQKLGLRMNGGLADGQNKNMSASERYATAHSKLNEQLPGNERMSQVSDSVRNKIENQSENAKKGGVAYMLSAAGCISVKAPSYIAAGVAAVQLAQIMPSVTEVILSPGSKAKTSGVETEHSISSEDMDLVGTMLTMQVARKLDGKKTAAVDSKHLMAALGVNTAKMKPSKYAPGHAILQSDAMAAGRAVEQQSKQACSVIMSPAAMWTAFMVDSAITVAASSTIVGGIIKVAVSAGVNEVINRAVAEIGVMAAEKVITDLATNEDIPNARGEEFGDILGVAAMTFFSSGGMARHLPTLSESQLVAYEEVKQDNIAYSRELELASVHPLDPSSSYTITGSIISSLKDNALRIGSYGKPFGMLASMATLPVTGLSSLSTAHAADQTYCSYAADFGLNTGNPATTPALNASGMPCTGINKTQANMASDEALQILIKEGWVDEAEFDNLAEDATISDLVTEGVIKPDNPLHEFINSCSNPDTGDHIFAAAGCIKPDISGGGGDMGDICAQADDRDKCEVDFMQNDTSAEGMGIDNPLALDAMSVFLVDYQLVQSINGDDEYVPGEGAGPVNETEVIEVSGDWTAPMKAGSYRVSSRFGMRTHPVTGVRTLHNGVDLAAPHGTPYYAAAGGVVTAAGPKSWGTNYISIDHGGGITTEYGHSEMGQMQVKVGDKVQAGQMISYVGNQGQSTGAHLHFNYLVNGKAIEPQEAMRSRHGITL